MKIMSLKIPTGWAVVRNTFGDEDPIIVDGQIVNDEFYSEDLLSIESIQFDGMRWIAGNNGYLLDLGWYPEADPNGKYRLILIWDNWENIVFKIESNNRYKIRDSIDKCLDLIDKGISRDEILNQIEYS